MGVVVRHTHTRTGCPAFQCFLIFFFTFLYWRGKMLIFFCINWRKGWKAVKNLWKDQKKGKICAFFFFFADNWSIYKGIDKKRGKESVATKEGGGNKKPECVVVKFGFFFCFTFLCFEEKKTFFMRGERRERIVNRVRKRKEKKKNIWWGSWCVDITFLLLLRGDKNLPFPSFVLVSCALSPYRTHQSKQTKKKKTTQKKNIPEC